MENNKENVLQEKVEDKKENNATEEQASENLDNNKHEANMMENEKDKMQDLQSAMVKCENCGTLYDIENSFCPNCGMKRKALENKVCSNCGAEIVEGQEFCSKCGHKVESVVEQGVKDAINTFNNNVQTEANTKTKKKNIKKIIIGIIVAAIILVVFVFVFPKNNLNSIYDTYCDSKWAEIASDGTYLKIDTNPYNYDDSGIYYYEAYEAIEDVNEALGLPSSLFNDMKATSGMDGKQYRTYENVKISVSWSYHPDYGLEVMYSKM